MFKLTIEEAQVALNWYASHSHNYEPSQEDKNLMKSLEIFLNEDFTQEETEEEV